MPWTGESSREKETAGVVAPRSMYIGSGIKTRVHAIGHNDSVAHEGVSNGIGRGNILSRTDAHEAGSLRGPGELAAGISLAEKAIKKRDTTRGARKQCHASRLYSRQPYNKQL